MSSRIIKIRDDNGRMRVIGEVVNKVLILSREKSKHLFRKTNSWGLDAKVAEQIEGVTDILVIDTESKNRYRVSLADFLEKSERMHFGEHRSQRFLMLTEWEVLKYA